MNEHFLSELQSELQSLQSNNLYKKERIITSPQGPVILTAAAGEVINFCANNYLGLSSHPEVIQAAKATIDSHGYGMSCEIYLWHSGYSQTAGAEDCRFLGHGGCYTLCSGI